MSNVLLRVLRFRASILLPTADAFFAQELTARNSDRFEDDLSIFEIMESEIVRMHAEYIGNGLSPKNNETRSGVNLLGAELPTCAATPGKSKWFKFFRDRHRSISLFDEEEARDLARQIFAGIVARERAATEEELRAFVKERIADSDPEWFTCLNDPDADAKRQSQCRAWRKWLARQPPPPAKPTEVRQAHTNSDGQASLLANVDAPSPVPSTEQIGAGGVQPPAPRPSAHDEET